jgi:LysM repeat protein
MEKPMENENKTENAPSPGVMMSSLNKRRFPLSSLEIVFGSLIILGLIYLGYVIFFQDSPGSLSNVEKRIQSLETAFREQGEGLEKKIKSIQDNQAQWETRLKALENASRLITTKPQPPNVEEKKPPSVTPGKKEILHKVKKGETLYSIAARYKISTKDLLQWNKMSKEKPVRPGDSLIIISQ